MLKRTPVLLPPLPENSFLKERTWVRAETLRVMGIDPGWAKMGICVLEQTMGGPIRVKLARLAKTEKGKDAKAKMERVSIDDGKRLRELWYQMAAAAQEAGTVVSIAAEAYAPFKAAGGNAWKSAMAYALVHGYGLGNNILIQPFLPMDLKKAFGLSKSASKDEVGAAIQLKVEGLTEALALIRAQGDHEHVTDAAGHAYLGLMEIYKLRQQTGVVI